MHTNNSDERRVESSEHVRLRHCARRFQIVGVDHGGLRRNCGRMPASLFHHRRIDIDIVVVRDGNDRHIVAQVRLEKLALVVGTLARVLGRVTKPNPDSNGCNERRECGDIVSLPRRYHEPDRHALSWSSNRRASGRACCARLPLSAASTASTICSVASHGPLPASASRMTSKMPLSARRRNCRWIESHLPSSSGSSHNGAPIHICQKTAPSTRRWPRGGRPVRWIREGSRYAHSSSVISSRIATIPRKGQP